MAVPPPLAFFSYSRQDSEFALRLASELRAAGASVWLDQLDIRPGQRWDHSVEEALRDCPCLLVILSPESIDSTNVMDEVSFALEEKKIVIPILYRECKLPFRLRRLHYINFTQNYDRALQDLLGALHAITEDQSAGKLETPDYVLKDFGQGPEDFKLHRESEQHTRLGEPKEPKRRDPSSPRGAPKKYWIAAGVLVLLLLGLVALRPVLTPHSQPHRLSTAEKRALELRAGVVLVHVNVHMLVKFEASKKPYEFAFDYDQMSSGFIYRPDGYIITNAHVIADINPRDPNATSALIRKLRDVISEKVLQKYLTITGRKQTLRDAGIVPADDIQTSIQHIALMVYLLNKSSYNAEVKAYSPPFGDGGKSVAIVKIDARDLPTVHLGDSSTIQLHDPVTVIGYPQLEFRLGEIASESSFKQTEMEANISAIKTAFPGTQVIQFDGEMTPGNDGGPVFNKAGEVIGVAIFAPQNGLNFAVPINTAQEVVKSVGASPQAGVFNQLWLAALDTYDTGNCALAKSKLQSVLNIVPNEPDALRLIEAADKCASQ